MKKPFTLNFVEKSNEEPPVYSSVIYDERLNLSVDINSGIPAFDVLDMDTMTGTKVHDEVTDSDNNLHTTYLDTLTRTRTQVESTDLDSNFIELANLLDTCTLTESHEATDSDKNNG
ncbi:hypothetical protein [[Muricauda] lutisoli]|uniref:Uncharacterized protein n=1 Tax=[Muricauda] lutisoli TaxID=2816035 RepID=A0ABS3EWG0_9FLAO|nr:hypothetical protein [[Muricauda] lutisoli]MBO0330087.1 hypothetical protein [[Muricauda] lutisoli]